MIVKIENVFSLPEDLTAYREFLEASELRKAIVNFRWILRRRRDCQDSDTPISAAIASTYDDIWDEFHRHCGEFLRKGLVVLEDS